MNEVGRTTWGFGLDEGGRSSSSVNALQSDLPIADPCFGETLSGVAEAGPSAPARGREIKRLRRASGGCLGTERR